MKLSKDFRVELYTQQRKTTKTARFEAESISLMDIERLKKRRVTESESSDDSSTE
jgi:hypothetical protein